MRALVALYNPMFDWVVKHAKIVAPLALVPILATAPALSGARPRVHAEARGGKLLDPRDLAALDLARPVGEVRRADARDRARLPGRSRRAVRRRAPDASGGHGRRLAARPTGRRDGRRPASTTSSSSRRSSRSTSGRAE